MLPGTQVALPTGSHCVTDGQGEEVRLGSGVCCTQPGLVGSIYHLSPCSLAQAQSTPAVSSSQECSVILQTLVSAATKCVEPRHITCTCDDDTCARDMLNLVLTLSPVRDAAANCRWCVLNIYTTRETPLSAASCTAISPLTDCLLLASCWSCTCSSECIIAMILAG